MLNYIRSLIVVCLVWGVASQAYSLDSITLNWSPPLNGDGDGVVVVDSLPDVGVPLERSPASASVESNESLESCAAPNNGGLRALLRELRPLIPGERIKRLVHGALRSDPQMRALQQLARTPAFRENVRALRLSPEVGQLRSTACRRLYVPLQEYVKFVRTLFHVHGLSESGESASDETTFYDGRPGFAGLCEDIIDTLPRTQLRAIYQRRMQNDVDLANSIAYVRGTEFRQLLGAIRARAEYKELQRMVNAIGVSMADLRRVIDYALGRNGQGNGSEELIYLFAL